MSNTNFTVKVVVVTLAALLPLVGVRASPSSFASIATPANLAPLPQHSRLDRAIAELLDNYHYRNDSLDNEMSGEILETYLDALDFNRSYFLANDVESFKRKYRYTLDDYLRSGDLTPAYEIFNVFRQRLVERVARLKVQLKRPISFDVDETIELDREKAPWASSKVALDEVWRKRLKNELLQLVLAGKDFSGALETLEKRYDARLRRTAQSTSDDVFQAYMNAVSRSFDPHTAYFSPRNSENFDIQMRLSLEGIGTVLRMEEDQITVVELVPGGPADLSKQLKPNDKIVGVGQGDYGQIEDVIGWRLDDVVDLIRGRRGTVVRLRVTSGEVGASDVGKVVRLVRDTIKLENQAADSEIKTLSSAGGLVRVGIITIPTFYSDFAAAQRGESNYRSTSRDVRRILRQLKRRGVDGIVVDLRQNGGGSLQEAVELTGLFIKDGPIVQVRDSSGEIEIERDPDPTLVYDGPLVVMVDRFSASASEIFAGAIQDYGRGVIVGNPTFGKGTVQTLVDLDRFVPRSDRQLGQLKLTIAKFYRVNGSSTQHRGVLPDIRFPAVFGVDEIGESSQENALPWDKITPIRHRGSRFVSQVIPDLRRRHQARLRTEPALKLLLEDIQEAKRARDRTRVSLLESKRRAERSQLDERRRARENQLRRAQGLKPLEQGQKIPDDASDEGPDPLLDESVRVMADLINLIDRYGAGTKALVMTE
jgi:carboxyl-terminal processing protease